MKKFLLDHRLSIIGAVAGALAGWVYWYRVGCDSGTCAITSSPINSSVYFALMGSLLFGIFKTDEKKSSS